MKLQERIESYRRALPRLPCTLQIINGRMEGVWFLGNNYQNKSKLYGAYPGNYLKRITSLFPEKKKVLHLFSGSLKKGAYMRFDISPVMKPDVCGDAHALKKVFSGRRARKFDVIFADPPYSDNDAVRYGTVMINRIKVMEGCHSILEKGGHLVWLDQALPMFSKKQWKLMGAVGIVISTNHRVRFAFIFEKV